MRQLFQQLAVFTLVFALLLSLAACGEKDSPKDTGTEHAAGSTDEPGQQTETEASARNEFRTEAETVYNGLFDDKVVHAVDVTISEDDWADLLENPLEKTKYKTTVIIDGETMEQVSFATKGNTSLSSVASDPDSDRYSFKLNFGKFNKGQSYHGLDKLNLNNLYADATCLKDWLCYRIFRQAGVDAPLASYVWLRINGQDQGLYLAIEEISESWLNRTQEGEGVLYKPETEEQNPPDGLGIGEHGANSKHPGSENPPTAEDSDRQGEENGENYGQSGFTGNPPQGFPGNGEGQGGFPGGMGFGSSAKGADLRYSDDDPESYSDIFDNNETKLDEGAEARVISALKELSEGNPEEALDTDEVIRYFAAHNFVLNYDSYTGNMLHNYYLYENDGKLRMIPWDYNLAFGGFGGGMGGDMGSFPGNQDGQGGFPGVDAFSGATPSTGESSEQGNWSTPGGQSKPGDMRNPGNNPNQGDMPNPGEMGNFGEMGGTNASSLINTGIDSPLSGTTADSRPMWAWIAADESYLTQYHEALEELVSSYFESGAFEEELDRMASLIRPYVEKDPTAFYSLSEFDTGVETLKRFCLLRAESIRKQLDGDLATQTDQQDSDARVEASDLNVQALGGMGGGRDKRNGKK